MESLQTRNSEEIVKVMLIGATGVGKSSTCQSLCENGQIDYESIYKVYHGCNSGTEAVNFRQVKWRNSNEDFLLVDTPGFSDSNKEDDEISDKMIIYLSTIKYVNMILIVLNSQQPRIDGNIKKMLTNFTKIFGSDFKKHINFVYTNWGLEPSDIKNRSRQGVTQESKTGDLNKILRELDILGKNDSDIKCFFFDNTMVDLIGQTLNDSQQQNMNTFYSTISDIQQSSTKFGKLSCLKLTKLINENQNLSRLNEQHKKEMEDLKKALQKYEKAAEDMRIQNEIMKKQNDEFVKKSNNRRKQELGQIYSLRCQLDDFPEIADCLGKCKQCIDAQVDQNKDYCSQCDQLYQSLMTHSYSYCVTLIQNVLVLRSSNCSFLPASSRITKMYYYKSSLSKDWGVDNTVKKVASLFSKVIVGTWLHHTFMVFSCCDANSKNIRRFSIDLDKKGLKIKYDERVFESRRDFALDYETDVSTDVGSVLNFAVQTFMQKTFDVTKYNSYHYSNEIWDKFK